MKVQYGMSIVFSKSILSSMFTMYTISRDPLITKAVSISYIGSILPKGPYPPCLRMADRALLAGYPQYVEVQLSRYIPEFNLHHNKLPLFVTNADFMFSFTYTVTGVCFTIKEPWQKISFYSRHSRLLKVFLKHHGTNRHKIYSYVLTYV